MSWLTSACSPKSFEERGKGVSLEQQVPVMIDVEAEGKALQEMHVDGGTVSDFRLPGGHQPQGPFARAWNTTPAKALHHPQREAGPEWAQVDRRRLPIALRAISALIQYQGIGDLYRIFTIAQRDDVEFNLAFIPATFNTPYTADFDTPYLRKLFDLGYAMAEAGYPWHKKPPVLLSGDDAVPPEPQ